MSADAGYAPNIGKALTGIAYNESSHDPRNIGDGGTSYGLFQLHRNGGVLGNMSDAEARKYLDARTNTAYVLRAIKPLVHNGMTTAQAVDAIARRFERPADPGAEIRHAMAYLAGGGSSPQAPTSSATPLGSAGFNTDAAGGPSRGLIAAVQGGYRNEDALHLPHITLPDIGGQIPFRASVDPGIAPHQVPGPSQMGEAIVNAAKHFLGVPYVWGGTSPKGFDCSGLVQYVFGKFGVKVPRIAADQFNAGMKVNRSQAQPGDVIGFSSASQGLHHIGIYIGNGLFIQAPHTGDVVKISKLSDRSDIAGFRRFAKT
jgi:cell wall-associated NlpC family hydrolase